MVKLDIEVTYTSGESVVYTAALPEWSKWERKTGKTVYSLLPKEGEHMLEKFQQSDFLFLAHSAYVRQAGGTPVKPYDIWELSVEAITIKDSSLPKVTKSEVSTENA